MLFKIVFFLKGTKILSFLKNTIFLQRPDIFKRTNTAILSKMLLLICLIKIGVLHPPSTDKVMLVSFLLSLNHVVVIFSEV